MDEAPGLEEIDDWMNTDPLTLPSLEGQPVLVGFWTYSCPHCAHDIRAMRELWEAYQGEGLEVVGVHSPEFAFEEEQENVADAVERRGIGFPVGLDPTGTVWKRYGDMQRPRQAIVGPQGTIRYESIGVGGHAALEEKVRRLVRQGGGEPDEPIFEGEEDAATVDAVSPDLYTGETKGGDLGNDDVYAPHTTATFTDDGDHELNRIYLEGAWRREPEYLVAEGDGSAAVRFSGSSCYVVLDGDGQRCRVKLDGGMVPEKHRGEDVVEEGGGTYVEVERPGMYEVVERGSPRISELEITPDSGDVRLYRFVFR